MHQELFSHGGTKARRSIRNELTVMQATNEVNGMKTRERQAG